MLPKDLTISSRGLDLIKSYESFASTPYLCPAKKKTVGYGHVILPADNFRLPMTTTKALEVLKADCALAEKAIHDGLAIVSVQLSQNEFDALVSFVFNIGITAFSSSTLLRRLCAGDKTGAANEFPRWIHANGVVLKGLVARRTAEQKLFLAR